MEYNHIPMTCPMIDEVIELIEISEINQDDKLTIIDRLEAVRSVNIKLREYANQHREIVL